MLKTELLEADGLVSIEGVDFDRLNNKTILITGASGIIGTDFLYGLYQKLRLPGNTMRVIAVVNKGIPDHFHLLKNSNLITFFTGDLTDDQFLKTLPKADIIIHAATYGQPARFMEYPENTIKLNTTVTLFLLEKILNKGGRFLFISTSEVYSGHPSPLYHEDQIGTTSPGHNRACYIEAKRCGETIINIFRNKGVSAVSARLSLAYGPGTRLDDKRVLNNFIEKALVGKEIRLLDSGSAKRTYCYVSDAVNMMWKILLEGKDAVYNVGGISRISIIELAELVGKIISVPVIVPHHEDKVLEGSPEDVRLDISRYTTEFGNRTFVNMKQGIIRTIDWQSSMFVSK